MQPTPPTAPDAPAETFGPPRPSGSHEEITRHLAAAVQLNPELSHRVIRGHLSAPWEALPSSPGVDAGTVLTQAFVARHRRRVRDALVLVLMTVAALSILPYTVSFGLFLATVWLGWSLVVFLRRTPTGGEKVVRDDENRISIGGTVITTLFLLWLLGTVFAIGASIAVLGAASSYYGPDDSGWFVVPTLVFLLCVAAIYLVLLADKMVMQHLLATHGGSVAASRPSPPVARLTEWLTSAVMSKHGTLLHEVAERSNTGNVLVHGSWNAFVGHGTRVNAWTLPLVLRARESDSGEITPLRPPELYEAINTELCTMREADLLAPGQRFRELTVTPLIVASHKGLSRYRHSPLGRELLPETDRRPASALRAETLQNLMDQDQEWVRHFQRSSVTSWDSDLLVSTFLNIGCDNRTLYLEWNAYCLFPVARRYRKSGHFRTSSPHVAGLAAVEFLQLLGSIPRRWRTLWQLTETLRTTLARKQADDPELDRHRIEGLREAAADVQCASEFQDLDGQRHIKLLEERMFSAVRHHLKERGYDTEGLDQQSTQIINNTNNNFGSSQFVGAQNFGAGGTAKVTANRKPREDS